MKAVALVQRRVIMAPDAFVELVIWAVAEPLPPSSHRFKYRLAYVVGDECVVRYDNERGKGDHRHYAGKEVPYRFVSPDHLMEDFSADVEKWNLENGRA